MSQAVPFKQEFKQGPMSTAMDPSQDMEVRRFIVGLDFGTTFSSVSVLCVDGYTVADVTEVQPIANYPGAPSLHNETRRDVPTEAWYRSGAPHRDPVKHLNMFYKSKGSRDTGTGGGRDQYVSDYHTDTESDDADDITIGQYYWGYEVRRAMRMEMGDPEAPRPLQRFKLLLDQSAHTKALRQELKPMVGGLQESKAISSQREVDIIADFLERLFWHTKDQMKQGYAYNDGEPVEFALCIPAVWTRQASRKMQMAMTAALHRTGFITTAFHDVDSLLIIHEPEAAASFMMAESNSIWAGESFILLDAGGGTVDAITYKVASRIPLKLDREEVAPAGSLCGSSYLNQAFEKLVRDRLEGEDYLRGIEAKIDRIVDEFETDIKRTFDSSRRRWRYWIPIDGLKENPEKKLAADGMIIDRSDMKEIFRPRLQAVTRLMLDQLEEARMKNISVSKVVLIGGFGESPTLYKHLHSELDKYSKGYTQAVQLIRPLNFPGNAVASGAVLRALRRNDAPSRTSWCSYGLMRKEPYDKSNRAHREQNRHIKYDRHDGCGYIWNTIDWFVQKGDVLAPGWVKIFQVAYTFDLNEPKFLCEELLYVSDKKCQSHYRRVHPNNQGSEEVGRIVVDMTELKKKRLIRPVSPEDTLRGKRHYLVEFDLAIMVDGLNLQVEARYPCGSTGESSVKQRGRICISTAFMEEAD